MKLQSVQISNYRSIEDASLEMLALSDNSQTYGLIGVNEAGKSSLLKALAMKDGVVEVSVKDFRDKSKNVEVVFNYKFDESELPKVYELWNANTLDISFASQNIEFESMDIQFKYTFKYARPSEPTSTFVIPQLAEESESNVLFFISMISEILADAHKTIFWTADDNYLISKPIALNVFAQDPDSVSIPLKNCFSLAGITDISARIGRLSDSTEIELLQTELGESVTSHIKVVWPKHPITITFLITDGQIHFHVKDNGAGGRAKTADQRSDGFKQFVSFLLTVSAQNKNEELANTILLLDEPETHLHPQAQEYLLSELVKITKNARNNIVFFATHSNYMIDKSNLGRNLKVFKLNDFTSHTQFDSRATSYAGVTYEVFDILNTDYHNELYGILHSRYQEELPEDPNKAGIKNFDTGYLKNILNLPLDKPWKGNPFQVTLPTFVRNCIHHPEAGSTYTQEELRHSIETLRAQIST